MSIESVMPSNHLILCRPLLLSLSIFPSIRVFSNESALRIRWPKYWSFSFSISPAVTTPKSQWQTEHKGLFLTHVTRREGNGNTLQYSCLENPMDGGAWWAAVHGVAKSRTRLKRLSSSSSSSVSLHVFLGSIQASLRKILIFLFHLTIFLNPCMIPFFKTNKQGEQQNKHRRVNAVTADRTSRLGSGPSGLPDWPSPGHLPPLPIFLPLLS